MPVVTDPRTGKPEYFCDDCGQMAHWGITGAWYCWEHKDRARSSPAEQRIFNPMAAGSIPAAPTKSRPSKPRKPRPDRPSLF